MNKNFFLVLLAFFQVSIAQFNEHFFQSDNQAHQISPSMFNLPQYILSQVLQTQPHSFLLKASIDQIALPLQNEFQNHITQNKAFKSVIKNSSFPEDIISKSNPKQYFLLQSEPQTNTQIEYKSKADLPQQQISLPKAQDCKCQNQGLCKAQFNCVCPKNFVGDHCELTGIELVKRKKIIGNISLAKQYMYIKQNNPGFYFLSMTICAQGLSEGEDPNILLISSSSLQQIKINCRSILFLKKQTNCTTLKKVVQIKDSNQTKITFFLQGNPIQKIQQNMNNNESKIIIVNRNKTNIGSLNQTLIGTYTIELEMQEIATIDVYFQLVMFIGWSCLLFVLAISLTIIHQMCRRRRRVEQHVLVNESIDHFANLMPLTKYSKTNVVVECSVCLLELQNQEEIRKTPCMHLFHKDCIDQWCVTKLSCPVCRSDLTINAFNTLVGQ